MAGAALGSRGRTCIIIAALEHIIAWVLITAFGIPVEPEVNSSLPTVSGVIFAIDCCDRRRHRRRGEIGEGEARDALGRIGDVNDGDAVEIQRVQRLGKLLRVLHQHHAPA